MLTANVSYLLEILYREVIGRCRTHIEALNAKINAASTSLYSGCQRFVAADRSHNFSSQLTVNN